MDARERALDTVRAMTTKRSKYDPLATSRLSRWLVLRDMFHNVLDATELPPGTDLRQSFRRRPRRARARRLAKRRRERRHGLC